MPLSTAGRPDGADNFGQAIYADRPGTQMEHEEFYLSSRFKLMQYYYKGSRVVAFASYRVMGGTPTAASSLPKA